jgi:hypothetical protein
MLANTRPSIRMPIASTTSSNAIRPGASDSSRANWSWLPSAGRVSMITSSSPAISERQEKAQPCSRPAT